jgi:hypothetical protein
MAEHPSGGGGGVRGGQGWTGNSVGSRLVSVELWKWLWRVEEAQGAPGRSGGTWSEGGMVLEAGRQCQEGVLDGMRREAAPGARRSGWDVGPRGERLGQVRSVVWSGYSAGEGMWESRSLGQGSKEYVTGWSVTVYMVESGTSRTGSRSQHV